MRRKIVAGNWKMNKNVREAVALAEEVVLATAGVETEVVVCPAYPCLVPVRDAIADSHVLLGAQDVHWEPHGAYTGKVSCDMLKSAGVVYVVIGHSEQRQYFHETNETVNRKARATLEAGLRPIICVGETIDEREAGRTEAVLTDHVRSAYAGLGRDEALRTVIAYEPVWAIGTGKTATPAMAQEAHAFIRRLLGELYDADCAQQIRIQYGGSMKPGNAAELLAQPDIDGGLIGGASLQAGDFNGIVRG
jgi:triosephosphate isomerase